MKRSAWSSIAMSLAGLLLGSVGLGAAESGTAWKPNQAGPAGGSEVPAIQMLVPGFVVRALPVEVRNINTVRYRPDGKLVALGFDGKVYLLSDSDGDGLEDKVAIFYDPGRSHLSLNLEITPVGYPAGFGVFIARKGEVVLELDTNGDDRADKEVVVANKWAVPDRYPGGASDAVGVTVDAAGNVYFGLEAANSQNGYQLNKEKTVANYRLESERGTILKVSPDFSKREIIATGIRCSFGMAINAHGDLFATEQEGATWMPNGNPFDELLHIQRGRHYGFPPKHPVYLPNVVDEPSTFDYAPQHQATCGLFFNEPVNQGPVFGPSWWRGDAFVAGESRGKIYRTKLARTAAGYVAQNQIIAASSWLLIDQCVSPKGDLLVSGHSGPPDWGAGPNAIGRLFKITRVEGSVPRPVIAYAAEPTEVRVTFDAPLPDAVTADIASRIKIVSGVYVREGDAFESFRPGYRAVDLQQAAPRENVSVLGVSFSDDRRTLIVRTPERRAGMPLSIDIAEWPQARPAREGELRQASVLSLAAEQTGVRAHWKSASGDESWSGWLPHVDLDVARQLTAGSLEHESLWSRLRQAGTLQLSGQLDLWSMLRPALQPGSRLDYVLPDERVTVLFTGSQAPRLTSSAAGANTIIDSNGKVARLTRVAPLERSWIPFEVTLSTGSEIASGLTVTWSTAEDERARPLSLRRVWMPWAVSAEPVTTESRPVELIGGDWQKGQQLFAMCSMCHSLNGQGGQAGPDLSNLLSRDYASTRKDIVEPHASINPNHVASLIVLRNGESVTGVVINDNAERVLLAGVGGPPTEIAKSTITEIKTLPTSLMPEGYDQILGEQGLKDLLTFLLLPAPGSTERSTPNP